MESKHSFFTNICSRRYERNISTCLFPAELEDLVLLYSLVVVVAVVVVVVVAVVVVVVVDVVVVVVVDVVVVEAKLQ